jgi:hypothetical protein
LTSIGTSLPRRVYRHGRGEVKAPRGLGSGPESGVPGHGLLPSSWPSSSSNPRRQRKREIDDDDEDDDEHERRARQLRSARCR